MDEKIVTTAYLFLLVALHMFGPTEVTGETVPHSKILAGRTLDLEHNSLERLNYGAILTPIQGSFSPEVATYDLLFVIQTPSLISITADMTPSCENSNNENCNAHKLCNFLSLTDDDHTNVVNDVDLDTEDPNSIARNDTCTYLRTLLEQAQATKMAVSLELLQNFATQFRLISDLSDENSNRFARSPASESHYMRSDTLDEDHSSHQHHESPSFHDHLTISRAILNLTTALQELQDSRDTLADERITRQRLIRVIYQTSTTLAALQKFVNLEAQLGNTTINTHDSLPLKDIRHKIYNLELAYRTECTPRKPTLDRTYINGTSTFACSLIQDILHKFTNISNTVTRKMDEQLAEIGRILEESTENNRPRRDTNRTDSDDIPRMTEVTQVISSLNDEIFEITNVANELQVVISNVASIDSAPTASNNTRKKRGIFDLGGKILQGLFGVATNGQITGIKNALHLLEQNQFKLRNSFTNFEGHTVAAIRANNYHLQRLKRVVKTVTANFDVVMERLQSGIYMNTRYTTLAVSMVSTLLHDLSQLRQEMNDVLTGLRALLRQELSVTLIHDKVLSNALNSLERHLSRTHPVFHIAEKNTAYYYKYSKPTFTVKNDTIIVHVAVPLSASNMEYDLYRVRSVEMPLDENSTLSTELVVSHDIFGISRDQNTFILMKYNDLQACTQSRTLHCKQAVAIHDKDQPTCNYGLYMGNSQIIRDHCTYHVKPRSNQVDIEVISPGRLLVHNAEIIAIGCPKPAKTIRNGCKICIYDQPCACYVTATGNNGQSLTLPPVLDACTGPSWSDTLHFPVNLPVLHRITQPSAVYNYSADTYLKQALHIPITNKLISDKIQNSLNNRKLDYNLDLDTAFSNLAQDPIELKHLTDNMTEPYNLWNNNPVLIEILVATAAFALITIACVVFYCVYKSIQADHEQRSYRRVATQFDQNTGRIRFVRPETSDLTLQTRPPVPIDRDSRSRNRESNPAQTQTSVRSDQTLSTRHSDRPVIVDSDSARPDPIGSDNSDISTLSSNTSNQTVIKKPSTKTNTAGKFTYKYYKPM